MRRALLFVLLILAAPAHADDPSPPARQVQNSSQFVQHMHAHILRVRLLGVMALRRYPGMFPRLNSALVTDFLRLHDQSKVNTTPEFLKAHGLDQRTMTIAEDLYANLYGKNIAELPVDEQARAKSLIAELNRVDHAVADAFIKKHNLDLDQQHGAAIEQELRQIEFIADIVDRVNSPMSREEFSRVIPEEYWFFSNKKADEMGITLAHYQIAINLKGDYEAIVSGVNYPDFMQKCRLQLLPMLKSGR